jgi:hypothetical protein
MGVKMDEYYQNKTFAQLVKMIEDLEGREYRIFVANDVVYAIDGATLYSAKHGENLECIGGVDVGAPVDTPDFVIDALYGRAT